MVEINKAKGGKQIVVEENPVSRWLFSNTMSAWIWLVLRLYLGYSWLVAGWGKITDPAWTGEQAGVAVKGFMEGALSLVEAGDVPTWYAWRSEEHTSELQSRGHLVCRRLLEKKNDQNDS